MASLALGVKFNPAAGGLTDFAYSSAVLGYVGPAASNPAMVDGKTYRYRAESADLSQWEFGSGVYTAASQTIARTTITLSSTGAKVSFTAPPQVGIVIFPTDVLLFDDAMSLTTAQQDRGRANLAVVGRNVLINGDFRINQRVYVSTAALAAGAYGHDRWKTGAGASGGYTFTQLKSSTQITVTAGTLVQVVEDVNVVGGNYVLSWTGTATARVGVNSATPSGSFVASPILITGQTAGTVMSVEFAPGTLGQVQLEAGTAPTPFEFTSFSQEMAKCQRYFTKSYNPGVAPGTATNVGSVGSGVHTVSAGVVANAFPGVSFLVPMRTTPTISIWSNAGGANNFSTSSGGFVDNVASILVSVSGASGFTASNTGTASETVFFQYTANAEL